MLVFRSPRALCLVVFVATACQAYDRGRYAGLLDGAPADTAITSTGDGGDALAPALDARDGLTPEGDVPVLPDAGPDGGGGASDGGGDGGCAACTAGQACCGSRCVSVLSDPANCGACGIACPHTACVSGSCTNTCLLGFDDCNRNSARDGCEADLSTDVANCGMCGNACALPHATPACAVGRCAVGRCADGFADCNGVAADGCEVDLARAPDHCAACATVCPAPAGAVATCAGGVCGSSCAAGFADCDRVAANGCETRLADAASCGACGVACSGATPVCSAAPGGTYACTSGCVAPTPTRCGSACVDTMRDAANCGGCGTTCAAPTGGTATCAAGVCGASCPMGSHVCSGACVSDAAPATCGTRCTPCPAPMNGTATCLGSTCGILCNLGRTACGGACVDVTTDAANCGTCGHACPAPAANGVATCAASTCGFTCSAGCTADAALGTCVCDPPAPRPVAPLSTSVVTVGRPALRWALASGTDGAQVTLCRNRALTTGCVTFTAVGSTGAPGMSLVSGAWYWQLRGRAGMTMGARASSTWEFFVPVRASGGVNTSWGTVFDANGDGLADVLAGASGANSGAGLAHVFMGSSMGLTPMPTTLTGGTAGLGASVASAGDFNGDGFADAVVGAPASNAAYIYRGSAAGIGTAWSNNLSGSGMTGAAVAAAGDIDGDGYGDVLVGQPAALASGVVIMWLGGGGIPSLVAPDGSGSSFGAAVAGAGDVNCDGFSDFVVGAPGVTMNTGRVYVYYGGAMTVPTAPSVTLTGPDGAGGRFGAAVAIAGDVNGDGCSDVIVGAPGAGNGRAYVYQGSRTGLVTATVGTLNAPIAAYNFGAAVSWAGDVNSDGYSDVIVGAPGTATSAGHAYIFTGAGLMPSPLPSATLSGPTAALPTNFGAAVGGLGSFTGDGYDDVVVGAPNANSGAGAVYTFEGAATFPSSPTGTFMSPTGAGASFGISVARLFGTFRPRGAWLL